MDKDRDRCDGEAPRAARRLTQALRTYRGILRRLLDEGWNAAGYTASAELYLCMQEDARHLPQLRTHWLDFLITRFEFTHALWDLRSEPRATRRLVDCHGQHAAALEKLLAQCEAEAR